MTTRSTDGSTTTADLAAQWIERWPDALELWSPFLTLRPPLLCTTAEQVDEERIDGSLAFIRLADQRIVVNLVEIAERGLGRFGLEILGHEVGHHVLAPADLTVNARLLARVRQGLPSVEDRAPQVANLWSDLLINDRLQRGRGLDLAAVFRQLGSSESGRPSPLWTFYMRTYEILWSLVSGTLTTGRLSDQLEADALLAARVVRTLGPQVVRGGGSFAALCLPYLLADQDNADGGHRLAVWADAVGAGVGGFPDGLTTLDTEGVVHPLYDPDVSGDGAVPDAGTDDEGPPVEPPESGGGVGQHREPFEYGELLRATGLDISDRDAAHRYYRERAIPHLVPFPRLPAPVATDPLPEGVESWDAGEPLADLDWTESLLRSPVVLPGVTTVQRVWGTSVGTAADEIPLDLDLYVDSSGSMPDPSVTVSYPALAGTIIALSALRAGANVQATLWSGTHQFSTTDGFVTDEGDILGVLTGHFGGGTAFPLHVLRDTYAKDSPDRRPTHVLVVSDLGVDTMFNTDEQGNDGRQVSNAALRAAGGGGTMVLQLHRPVAELPALQQAADDGWDIHPVNGLADLVAFARAFSERTYGAGARHGERHHPDGAR